MKNLKLNLKGLYGYRQSLLSRSPQPRDNREMSERRPSEERTLLAPLPQRFARYAAILIMLLTLGVGQMWADTRRIYCKSDQSWWYASSACTGVYAYKGEGGSGNENAAFPGVKMTETSSGSRIWYADIDTKYTNVIFTRVGSDGSNWGAQTGNLTLDANDNLYIITSSNACWKGDGCECTGYWSDYAPTPAIIGSMNSWNATTNVFSGSSGSVTCSVILNANTSYQFKVIDGTTWYGKGNDEADPQTHHTFVGQTGSVTLQSGESNIRLLAANGGTYVFTYNCTSHALSVAYPAVTHPSEYYTYFKNVNSWSTPITAHIWGGTAGTGTAWGNLPSLSTFNYDGTNYYYTARGDHTTGLFASGTSQPSTKTGDLSDIATSGKGKGKWFDKDNDPYWFDFKSVVTLNGTSPTTAGSANVTITYNTTTHTSITNPKKTGYTFAGWYTGSGGTGTLVIDADGVLQANVSGYTGAGGIWTKTTQTTLHAKWTQDPAVADVSAAGDVTELWIGVNASSALRITATSSNVPGGAEYSWAISDATSGSFTPVSSSSSSASWDYTPTTTGAKTITVTMTIGGNNYTKTYSLTVYERWNIYVRDDVDNWGTMKLYLYDNSTSTSKSAWPGDACSSYKSSAKWYTVTLDSKWPHFILNNNNANKQLLGDGSIAVDKSTYTPGSYWKTVWSKDGTDGDAGKKFYTLKSATITDPVVAITRCDVYSTYALLEGNVTGFGGDGSALSDLKEYGFYIGETKNTSIQSTSGTRFRVKVKSLTPGNTYNIKAFATNIDNTANSAVQSKTASNASRTIGVRYPDATAQTLKLYAYRDIPADYGTETVKNDVWSGVTLTRRAGTSRWWETTVTNAADYEYFIVSNNGSNQAAAQAMPATDKCYWYNPDGDASKIGIMDCPFTTPQLYINATAGATDYAYNEMSTSPSISKTMSLSAGTYTFKIMYNAEWYGKNSDNTISRTGATTSNSVSGMTIDQGYITLTADFAGDYIFTFNPSTNTVSVTYPTAYAVTYSKSIVGTDNSTTAAPSAAYTTGATAVTSGDLVPNGTNVTFTAAAAGTGYTWKGWYTVADPSADYSANRVATTAEYATTISAATTIYAVYAEDMHTVTVTAGTHGNITTPVGGSGSTVTAGIATSATIAAAAAEYGYVFKNWTITSGESTDVNFAGATTASTTITATADATVQANFISHWTVVGGDSETNNDGDDAMGNWNEYANAIDHFTQNAEKQYVGYAEISLPANTTFYVKIRDLHNTNWYGNTGEMTYTNNEGWTMESGVSTNCRITTAGAGNYIFTWNENTRKLTVTYPDSYTVTYGKVADNGQDIGGVTAIGDDDATLVSGKYVAKGSATFTAAAAANYTFIDWRTSATYGEGTQLSTDNPYTMTSIAENKTVYAHYAENMTTVTLASTAGGHIEIGGATVTSTTAGAVTTRSLTPVANTGYYFAGWTKTACTDYSISGAENSEDNTTITLTGLGTGATSGETLTANFVELEKVYFRNWNEDSSEPLWENVYAYFSISYENDGEGKSCAKSNSSSDYSGILMTQEGSTNVYWAYVPRGTTRNGDDDIAFSNHNFGTNYKFNGYEAVKRGDYKTGWNMFVPQSSNNETLNETKYYNGYWKHHNVAVGTDAGYRIERYNGSGYVDPADNGDGSEHHRDFTVTSENTIQYQLRVHNLTSGYNNYMIYNVGGTHYITFGESVQETGYTITNTDCSNIGLSEYIGGSPRFYITPTSEGIYTLTIDMSGDVMRLSVNYPVAVGDYMLVHSYNNGSAKTHYSDIIKSTEVSDRRYSMYIDNVSTHSPSLVLKKCTSISAGTPVWSPGNAVSMTGFTTDTKGVYVFDVTLSGDDAILNNIDSYTGNYYIKTDCATGGWTAYTQNVMEKNNATFSATDASTYDYLYCKWVDSGNGGDGGGTNVKCVIANDYCIAVSDTLEGDDILGGAQILPRAANVRFSYNSTTNTLKRTYINGATGWESSFLSLTDAKSDFEGTGDDMITHFDGTALNNDTLSFVDKNNWIYQRDLKAKPGTRIRLTANYKYSDKDHQQYLIGDAGDLSSSTTVQIIGGTTDEFIPMRAIYDFKTNNLIVGYLASDEEVTKTRALYADVLIVREDQEDAAQITFGDNVQFTEVDTVYGIIEFNKSTILDETKSIYERSLYWISFPFDVNLNEAFGFGEYGTHWMIQYYDGASRAQNGFWAEVETYWKWITPAERKAGFVLEANKGYLLGLDLDEMTSSSTVWGNSVTSVSLYFPSKGSVGTIESPLASSKSVSVTAHECTIERDDRWYKDANWNVIGVPSYANITKTVVDGTIVTKTETLVTQDVPFLYTHDMTDNTLEAVASSEVTFKSMQAYVVQYAGTIDWTVATTPFAAPKRTPEQNGERNLTLNLSDDNDAQDHTFIRFTYEEGITEGLDMNKDLTKEFKPTTNIYSLVQGRASQVQLAANLLPADYTSTTVEIGVRVAQTGYYTFSMPSTDGLSVVLYDRMTGTRTNLLIGTYRTELSAGTTNGRFVLEIGNAQAPTFIQSVDTDANGERVIKFVQDGQLYILKNGRVFNAEGKAIE